jgi:hypothetical protein
MESSIHREGAMVKDLRTCFVYQLLLWRIGQVRGIHHQLPSTASSIQMTSSASFPSDIQSGEILNLPIAGFLLYSFHLS